jgi:hypothetical protein
MRKSITLAMAILTLVSVTTVNAQVSCLRQANPITIQGSINVGDVQQAGRISRDGRPSNCSGSTSSLENNVALRRDAHNFTNPFNETVCVRADFDFTGCGGNQTMLTAYSNYNPAAPGSNVIGDPGFSTINRGSFLFSVGPNANYTMVIHEVEANTGCPLYNVKLTYLSDCRQPGFDATNDGKADPTIYRPSAISKWWTVDSESGNFLIRDFGTVGDVVTGGSDYTGDGVSDVSVYRPSTNTWYFGNEQANPGTNFTAVNWGIAGDRAVPGDYDGDGKNDIAIWRPSEGRYYVLRSSDGALQTREWGTSTDQPVSGDFDGDHLTDFAIARNTLNGVQWWILKSNYNYGFHEVAFWGLAAGDVRVPADYDGDGITDLAMWRSSTGTYYVRQSSNGAMWAFNWGINGDVPQPADYDGDGKADFAVFRKNTGVWYIFNSDTQTTRYLNWGLENDQPITSPYRIQ